MRYTKIFFVRHGQSTGNEKGLFYGSFPGDLSELGRKQARATAEYLKNVPFDKIYSSPLKRAYETARPTAEIHNMDIIEDIELREIHGGKWEQLSVEEIYSQYPEERKIWNESISKSRCPDGESFAEVYERASAHLKELAQENIGKTIILFTHAAFLRCIKCTWFGKGVEFTDNIGWMNNASVSEVNYYENGKFEIILDGFADHLKDISGELKL